MNKPMIFAHRGASGYAPENTLEAFELAVQQGADAIELDVHLSRDGAVVVAHDEAVDRVSNGHGQIAGMTLAELKRLSFSAGMPGFEKAQMPTLEEVYALIAPTGLSVNVELKTNLYAYPGIEAQCLEIAAKAGMERRILYSSFNHQSLLNIKALDAAQPCGLLYGALFLPEQIVRYAKELGMEALHPLFVSLIGSDLMAEARKAGVKVNAWTVNEEAHLRAVLAAGADGIITNYPDRAKSLI
jgi:glycerophosphoryl diester phosphodiesterase